MTEDDELELDQINPSEPQGSTKVEFSCPIPTVEQVTGQVARQVLAMEGYSDRPTLRMMAAEKIGELMTTIVAEKAAGVIDELLKRPVQKTDGYGNPLGEPISPLSLLTSQIEAWGAQLVGENDGKTKTQDSYGRTFIPRIEWTLKQVISRELSNAVDAEVKRIQAELKAAATQGIAQQIAAKVAGMVLK